MGLNRKVKRENRKMAKSKEAAKLVTVPDEISVCALISKEPMKQPTLDEKGAQVPVLNSAGHQMFNADGRPAVEMEEDDPWTIYRYLMMFVFQKEGWEKPLSKQRIQRRVLDAFDGAEPGTVVKVRGEDWLEVTTFLNGEKFAVPTPFGSQLLEMADAFLLAKDDIAVEESKAA